MTSPRSAQRVGCLAIAAVGASLALIPLAGAASAGTAYGAGTLINCTATYSNGVVTVSSTGFTGTLPASYTFGAGGSTGSGQGSSFSTPLAGVPAGTVFSATITEEVIATAADGSSTDTKQSCTSSVTVGSGPVSSGASTVAIGGGGGSVATTPVSFVAPVAVAGTTTTKAPASKAVKVLGESVSRSATAGAASTVGKAAAGASTGSAAPGSSLAFTGSDDIVSGSILGISLVAGGAGFILASRKRSRRRNRRTFA